jgi:GNAT superfamily N-acetyltransferase
VIVPTGKDLSDPFEPLGRSLAKRHSRIRHVPYVPKYARTNLSQGCADLSRNGITSTHLAFIKRGHVVILCLIDQPSQPLPLGLADSVFAAIDANPCVLVVCSCPEAAQRAIPFPTVIRITGHAPSALEAAAGLIFGEPPPPVLGPVPPRPWTVEPWNEARDIASVLNLWTETVSSRFSLDHQTFAALLRRPGYAKHYVVRDRNETVLGFCATYLSYADRAGENLIASLAALLVRPRDRNRGVGSNLHAHALAQLRRTRGVVRYQLGSTFPRLLYGPPLDSPFDESWFRRRGWSLPAPRLVHDLLLLFSAWRPPAEDTKLSFRACTPADGPAVLALVDREHPAAVDQYAALLHSPHVADILLTHTDHTLVAAALTYSSSSPLASTLPWAARTGYAIAGVSCICISRALPTPI